MANRLIGIGLATLAVAGSAEAETPQGNFAAPTPQENPSVEAETDTSIAKPMRMGIESVFSISSDNSVVGGHIQAGNIAVGEEVLLIGFDGSGRARVTRIEVSRKAVNSAQVGDHVFILLEGIPERVAKRAMLLVEPDTLSASEIAAYTAMPAPDIVARVTKIFAEHLGVSADRVTPQARIIEDLDADSLDLVELVIAAEEEFGIEIPDSVAEQIVTVGDAMRLASLRSADA